MTAGPRTVGTSGWLKGFRENPEKLVQQMKDWNRRMTGPRNPYSEGLGKPDYGPVIAVSVDRNVGIVPLEGITHKGSIPLVLQGSVKEFQGESELPVAPGLSEERVST